MIKLIAKKLIREGKVEEVIKLYKELGRSSKIEEGCIKYELYQDEKDFRILAVVEEWENKDALNKHTTSEHFNRIVPMISELTEKKLDMNLYNKLI